MMASFAGHSALHFASAVSVLLLCSPALLEIFGAAADGSAASGGEFLRGSGNCDVDLSAILPPPYSNVSFAHCKPVWNTYTLRFHDNGDHLVTIVLSADYTTGWVGIGFSKMGMMVGSSAMVGWINRKGVPRIHQYYLQGYQASKVIPNQGELPLVNTSAAVVFHEATLYLAFQLKLDRPLNGQYIILAIGSAYPLHRHLSKHYDKTKFMFNYARAGAGDTSPPTRDYTQYKKNHGILAIIGWGLILPTGAIVARYFRHIDPLWFYLHALVQLVGFVIVLASVVVGQVLFNGINANVQQHRGIGIFAFVLSILQVLAFFARPSHESKFRRYWNWYHHWCGRIALFFGAVNVVLGIQLGKAGSSWKIGYGFILSIVLVSVLVLEALLALRRSGATHQQDPSCQMNPI